MTFYYLRISHSLSVIILNILKALIKRQKLQEWIKKYNPTICYLNEIHLDPKSKIV